MCEFGEADRLFTELSPRGVVSERQGGESGYWFPLANRRCSVTGRLLVLAVAVTGCFAVGVSAAATGPSTTITSPSAAQKVSLRRDPYLAVAGTASFATPTAPGDPLLSPPRRLRQPNDNPHLSVTFGTDAGMGLRPRADPRSSG